MKLENSIKHGFFAKKSSCFMELSSNYSYIRIFLFCTTFLLSHKNIKTASQINTFYRNLYNNYTTSHLPQHKKYS